MSCPRFVIAITLLTTLLTGCPLTCPGGGTVEIDADVTTAQVDAVGGGTDRARCQSVCAIVLEAQTGQAARGFESCELSLAAADSGDTGDVAGRVTCVVEVYEGGGCE